MRKMQSLKEQCKVEYVDKNSLRMKYAKNYSNKQLSKRTSLNLFIIKQHWILKIQFLLLKFLANKMQTTKQVNK